MYTGVNPVVSHAVHHSKVVAPTLLLVQALSSPAVDCVPSISQSSTEQGNLCSIWADDAEVPG